jgi:uncharacterized BrkB/YihY/UPF0761 family membrane protein
VIVRKTSDEILNNNNNNTLTIMVDGFDFVVVIGFERIGRLTTSRLALWRVDEARQRLVVVAVFRALFPILLLILLRLLFVVVFVVLGVVVGGGVLLLGSWQTPIACPFFVDLCRLTLYDHKQPLFTYQIEYTG